MRRPDWLLTSTGIVLLLASTVFGADLYRKEPQKGWWWYENFKQEDKPGEKPEQPALPSYPPEELWTMDPDRLREYAEEIKKEAVRLPSEANASELVWQKHPELSVAKDSPLATPGRNAVTREKVVEREQVLVDHRQDFALLYFTSAGCPFCQEQDTILRYFQDQFGWTVKPIDVDQNPILASRFDIQTTPTLLLIQRGSKEYIPVTAGVTSASEIESKLYRGIRLLRGDVTPENFNLYDFQKGGGFDVETGR